MSLQIERTFRRVHDSRFVMTVPDLALTFEADRVRRGRFQDDLLCELTVRCGLSGVNTVEGTLSSAEFSLSNARARQDRARLLSERARIKGVDWPALFEDFCIRVRDAERQGQPVQLLREFQRPAAEEELNVDGFPLLRRHPVCIYGDGGVAKSLLALWKGGRLAQQGTRTLLVDWELAGEDHRDRLERLFGPEMPAVYYVRCTQPLVHAVDALRRTVVDQRIDYLICDSVAFACHGKPEDAEVAAAYFRAVRQIGVGSLHIAHVTKNLENGDQRPFGSAFWHNGFRATWNIKLADSQPGHQRITIGMFNRKANLGPLRTPIGYEITFEDASTQITRTDLNNVQELASELPLWQRMQHLLKTGPLTLAEIASELNAKVDSIEKAVKRRAKTFTRVHGPDGIYRVANLELRRVS